jgi:hypothetical protein
MFECGAKALGIDPVAAPGLRQPPELKRIFRAGLFLPSPMRATKEQKPSQQSGHWPHAS